jgi:hypothetical protein
VEGCGTEGELAKVVNGRLAEGVVVMPGATARVHTERRTKWPPVEAVGGAAVGPVEGPSIGD